MYFRSNGTTDTYLGGSYNNMPEVTIANPQGSDNDYGLDGLGNYEESFGQTSIVHWTKMGLWSVKLKWTDTAYTKDLFYFCHVHDNMSGRIKLLKSDNTVYQSEDDPPLGYDYEKLSDWDASCGTNNLKSYAKNPMCTVSNYLCQSGVSTVDTDNEDSARRLSIDAERRLMSNAKSLKFDECLAVMDCAMHHDMKVYSHPTNPAATFVHQMIPHHINAINMAKSLLALDYLKCDENARRRELLGDNSKWKYQRKRALASNGAIEDEFASSGSSCEMIDMLKSIVNDQNAQVTMMRNFLKKAEMNPESQRCPASTDVGLTDTPVPFFILLGVLSAIITMTLAACKAYQFGMVDGREYEYDRLSGGDGGEGSGVMMRQIS